MKYKKEKNATESILLEEEYSKSNNKHKFPLVFQLNTIFTVRLMLLDITDELIDGFYIMEAINITVLHVLMSSCVKV